MDRGFSEAKGRSLYLARGIVQCSPICTIHSVRIRAFIEQHVENIQLPLGCLQLITQ